MDLSKLWRAWPVVGPWRLAPLAGGTNNVVWQAETHDGQAYVLRLTTDQMRLPRLRYEALLLQALADRQLPFALALPLRTHSGEIVAQFEDETGTLALASLYPLLPGQRQTNLPARHDPLKVAHAGLTLALLDQALAALVELPAPTGFQPLPTFGALDRWHPLMSDPRTMVEDLPLDRAQIGQIHTLLDDVLECVPQLYARLPQQLLHRDYDPSNILMEGDRVSAVLDFEFAGRDIRVLDLCVALSWWPVELLGTGQEWSLIDTFATAFTRQVALDEEELRAIPAVLRLRDMASLVHRIGRYLAGRETEERIQKRVEQSLWREDWLSTHRQTLLEHALRWQD